MKIMQEVIDYIKFTFRLLLTPHGIVALLVFLILYAVYLFAIQREKSNALTFVKLIVYPVMFTYGLFMLTVAQLLEKNAVQRLGLFITLTPIIISISISIIRDSKTDKLPRS